MLPSSQEQTVTSFYKSTIQFSSKSEENDGHISYRHQNKDCNTEDHKEEKSSIGLGSRRENITMVYPQDDVQAWEWRTAPHHDFSAREKTFRAHHGLAVSYVSHGIIGDSEKPQVHLLASWKVSIWVKEQWSHNSAISFGHRREASSGCNTNNPLGCLVAQKSKKTNSPPLSSHSKVLPSNDAVVSGAYILKVTNVDVIGLKGTNRRVCYWKSHWLLMTSKITDARQEPSTAALLNQHSF